MKLPDIQYRRNVPVLRSAKAAALPNKLRNINAAVGAAQDVAKTVDNIMESEAKLDASRRFNDVKRQYNEARTQLVQDYHTDADKDTGEYLRDASKLRDQAMATATSGASGRTNRYLQRELDNYRTNVDAAELDTLTKLSESRSLMSLTAIGQDSLATLSSDGDIGVAKKSYEQAVNATMLPADVKQEKIIRFNTVSAKTAVNTWVNAGDIASLSSFPETEAFKQLTPSEQSNVRSTILAATADITSEDMNLIFAKVDRGDMSLEQGWAASDAVIDQNALPAAQAAELKETQRLNIGSQYITGLLSNGQDQQVLDILGSDKYLGKLDATSVAGWRNTARSGLDAGKTANATMAMFAANNQIAIAEDGGEIDLGVVTAFTAAIPSFSESGQANAVIALKKLEAYTKHAGVRAATPQTDSQNLTNWDAKLAGQEQALLDNPGDNYKAESDAIQGTRKNIQTHIKEREDAPVDYAISNDTMTNKSWTTFQSSFTQFMAQADDAPTLTDVQNRYSEYKANVYRAQNLYSIDEADQQTIPDSPNMLAGISQTLMSGTTEQKMRAMDTANMVMGPDAGDLASYVMEEDAAAGFTMAFSTLGAAGAGDVQAMLSGQNRIQNETAPAFTDFKKSLTSTGVLLPETAMGRLNVASTDAIYAYAVGTATDEEISTGVFTEETLTRARNAVIGQDVSINTTGNATLTYRGADNQWVPKDIVTAQFRMAQLQPATADEAFGVPQLMNSDGSLEASNWGDILTYATPVMQRNGVYALSLPKSSPLGGSGVVLGVDAEGNTVPMEMDMTAFTLPSSAEAQAAKFFEDSSSRMGAL